jgi:hypothetical protein
MDDASPWSRRYTILSIANWIGFLAAVFLLSWAKRTEALPTAALALLVLLMTASVAVQFVAAFRVISRADEFVRAIALKGLVSAAGITMVAAVAAGLGEQFLGLPQLPMWLVYPFFWGAFGALSPFITDSRP